MKKEKHIILGIDPGSINFGYGIIAGKMKTPEYITHGVLRMQSKTPLFKRLAAIYNKLEEIITEYKPDILSIEQVFNYKNVKSTVILSHARAIALMIAGKYNIDLIEYSPKEVKLKVTGSGSADKERVRHMVISLLKIKNKKIALDASDALAIALCSHFQGKINTNKIPTRNKKSSWTLDDIKAKGLKIL